jgi:hypothetical protein
MDVPGDSLASMRRLEGRAIAALLASLRAILVGDRGLRDFILGQSAIRQDRAEDGNGPKKV